MHFEPGRPKQTKTWLRTRNRLGSLSAKMFTDKELKIVALALDSGAPENEWNNAANLFFKLLRNRSATLDEFHNNSQIVTVPIPPTQPDYGLTFMPWGQYKGEMFRDIPPGWLMAKRDWIRSAPDIMARWGKLAEAIDKFLGQ
jgi:hypothetical protein